MFLVRDIMYCKPGKVRAMAEKFHAIEQAGEGGRVWDDAGDDRRSPPSVTGRSSQRSKFPLSRSTRQLGRR